MNVPQAKAAIKDLIQFAADSYLQGGGVTVYWAEDPAPGWVSDASIALSVIGASTESNREVGSVELADSSLELLDVQLTFRSENEAVNPLALDLAQRVRQVTKRKRPEAMGAKVPSPLQVVHLPEDGRYKQFVTYSQEFRYEFHIEQETLETVGTILTVALDPEITSDGEV